MLPKAVSYCADSLETKEMFLIRYGAGKSHPSVKCTVILDDMVHGRKKPSPLSPATTETPRPSRSLEDVSGAVGKRRERQGQGWKLAEVVRLLLPHSLAK